MRALLPEGEIATEYGDACFLESVRNANQQRRATVCTRAMGQDEALARWTRGEVEESLKNTLIYRSKHRASLPEPERFGTLPQARASD